jgi:hypothetical protein
MSTVINAEPVGLGVERHPKTTRNCPEQLKTSETVTNASSVLLRCKRQLSIRCGVFTKYQAQQCFKKIAL